MSNIDDIIPMLIS